MPDTRTQASFADIVPFRGRHRITISGATRLTAWPCWAHRCGSNEVLATLVGAMAEQALERFSEHDCLLDFTLGRLHAPREKASGPPMPGTAPTLHR